MISLNHRQPNLQQSQVWFGPVKATREHYEAQVIGAKHVPEATVLAIEVGFHADLVLFDPATIGSGEIYAKNDLPGGTARLFAESTGMHRVFVNGEAIVVDGKATEALPGRVLRSGRDTDTVALHGA